MRAVRVIPATRDLSTGQQTNHFTPKRRVAGYARVSTDSEDQYASYEAQVDYYTTMIKANAEWELVGIYTDEGISGTSTNRREGFNRMIADALAGKIDLIVTKSVSRFARNTVDSLQTIRKLKEHKVEVYFEKESIKTFDSKGELLITIMSSLAQEESRSISENVKWGRRKRFADGQVTVPFTRFLGYDKGPDGNLVVNPEQAKLVRHIFSLFLQGLTFHGIAKRLESEGHKTGTGNSAWHASAVKHILTNVKYKGDALLQKYYIADFLTKKPVVNKGEIPQYYVEKNHEAIITPEVFDLVQKEIEYRAQHVETRNGTHVFSGRIRCGVCGGLFGPKVWHSGSKYRKVVWQCNEKYADRHNKCTVPHLSEELIKNLFVKAMNKFVSQKEGIIKTFEDIRDTVLDSSEDEEKLKDLEQDRMQIIGKLEQLTTVNASAAMDQDVYQSRYNQLSDRYHEVESQMSALNDAIQDRQYRKTKTELFLKAFQKQEEVVTGFSEHLWHSLADHAEVHGKEDVRFTFRNGVEIQA
ncbi:MAG: recombinase family protein [Spirochaetae bacterium HGW-Spirochaetae-2]|jgi:DNA invertase Pin-like site-specific DNA recombinase|nr:MAG: recombinase family protein [Spirochaetae bacterium HGW-Spirochaetae-2]